MVMGMVDVGPSNKNVEKEIMTPIGSGPGRMWMGSVANEFWS